MKLMVLSVSPGEDLQAVLDKIHRHVGSVHLRAAGNPESLMGNFKVLKLLSKDPKGRLVLKIDGPGFIIEQLYQYMLRQ